MGRPTDYTTAIADKICEGVAVRISLAKICASDPEMPAPRTVYRWLEQNEEFRHNYVRAREDQADFIAEELIEISDNPEFEPNDKRIMVDTRKWLASKYKPKVYGDKIQTEHSGEVSLNAMSDDALNARIAAILAGQQA
jgi:hypothetical protein